MKRNIVHSFVVIGLLIAKSFCAQGQSVLATGKWYKMAVDKNGVYRIDQSLFKKMGFSTSGTDPRNIKIFTQGAGMLPQLNSAPRQTDLTEIAIHIQGEEDGVFNQQDYILFYGEGADKVSYNQTTEEFEYESHLYSKSNFYFITVGSSSGKRITTSSNPGTGLPVIREYDAFSRHEINRYNELKSGRDWFGERFELTTEQTIQFDLANVINNSTIKIISSVMSTGFDQSSFNVSLNDVAVGEHAILPIPNTSFGIKGRQDRRIFLTNSTSVSASTRNTQSIKYQFIKNSDGNAIGFLDYCLLQVKRHLRLEGKQTLFRSASSVQNPASTFEISASTSSAQVWDVTNPFQPILQPSSFNSGVTLYSSITSTLKEFVVFLPNTQAPTLIGTVTNQNIRNASNPTLIIISHPDFLSEANRLKNHREDFSGINVHVVTTKEIYNEFSGGKPDITAIRDLARYYYEKNVGSLKSILLFGKASYDYNDILVDNKNFVPTYQSVNSLHPLLTYSSDDYFGFMDDNEGIWDENPVAPHTLDIAVGRLPVKTIAEAKTVVDKFIQYDNEKKLFASWRKNIYFIADDGDGNIHNQQADELAQSIDLNNPDYNTRKIYLDAKPQIPGAGGEISPETNIEIEKAFNEGALIINYTGHGGERIWAQERIFDDVRIQNLTNNRLPLLVTATCEFGRHDDPLFPSGGELSITQPNGGVIGLVTTTRPVFASTNFELNKAFYDAFFQKENGNNLSLGEIFRRTKNNSIKGVSNRNFTLIGDPSLTLTLPDYSIQVNTITASDDTNLLKALSKITVTGEVVNSMGEKVESFTGALEATLFDKKSSFKTLGNENPPFAYSQWFNSLFRGKARVENGSFSFQFILPKNISYAINTGKLSLYAAMDNTGIEAFGYSQDFEIGSSENNPNIDTTPPAIELFLGDLSFKNGGITGPNTKLIARLSDNSGINISGYGIGNSINASLDTEESFVLNNYYVADENDYTNGTIEYQLNNLKPGAHKITLRAWDVHNNPATASVDFFVTEKEALKINEFYNYPNPFNESTTIAFTHNQSGSDLESTLIIYDYTGHTIESIQFSIPESSYQVDLIELERNESTLKNLNAGLYVARLIVRSLSDGSKSERVTKLIITN